MEEVRRRFLYDTLGEALAYDIIGVCELDKIMRMYTSGDICWITAATHIKESVVATYVRGNAAISFKTLETIDRWYNSRMDAMKVYSIK